MIEIRFWGVRGSIAAAGPATARVGGNTSCVEVRGPAGELGRSSTRAPACARSALSSLRAGGAGASAHLLLSHFHWDHIQGFPFFAPAFRPATQLSTSTGPSAARRRRATCARRSRRRCARRTSPSGSTRCARAAALPRAAGRRRGATSATLRGATARGAPPERLPRLPHRARRRSRRLRHRHRARRAAGRIDAAPRRAGARRGRAHLRRAVHARRSTPGTGGPCRPAGATRRRDEGDPARRGRGGGPAGALPPRPRRTTTGRSRASRPTAARAASRRPSPPARGMTPAPRDPARGGAALSMRRSAAVLGCRTRMPATSRRTPSTAARCCSRSATLLQREVDLDELLRRIVDRIAAAVGADRGTLYLVDAAARRAVLQGRAPARSCSEIRLQARARASPARGARPGSSSTCPPRRDDRRFFREIDAQTGYRTRSMLAVPVARPRRRRSSACVQVLNAQARALHPRRRGALRRLCAEAALAIERTSLYAELRRPAQRRRRRCPMRYRFNRIVGESAAMRRGLRAHRARRPPPTPRCWSAARAAPARS